MSFLTIAGVDFDVDMQYAWNSHSISVVRKVGQDMTSKKKAQNA